MMRADIESLLVPHEYSDTCSLQFRISLERERSPAHSAAFWHTRAVHSHHPYHPEHEPFGDVTATFGNVLVEKVDVVGEEE